MGIADGGHDALLSREGRRVWHVVVAGVILVGAGLIALARFA
jgi:hypothetical protein